VKIQLVFDKFSDKFTKFSTSQAKNKKQGKKKKEKKAPFLVSIGRGPNSRGYGWTCSLHVRIHV
jgi:hypothetical protein